MVWCGSKVLIKETNRVSDVMRVVLVDVEARTGKTVRTVDVGKMDGGWFEISQKTRYIPADAQKGRKDDGYIDTVVYNDGDHLAYFTPLDNPEAVMLTGRSKEEKWEVVDAPSAVDLDRNLVYFVATKESSIQRHVYSVNLAGENLAPFTDTTLEGHYAVSFSSKSGYALLSYNGPNIPWQKVLSTPSNPTPYAHMVENNTALADKAAKHELPILQYGTVTVSGVHLNYVERRPPHFDPRKRYPVIFYQYSGPGSQTVSKGFGVDFQSYLAAGLGYICVTVDGRGTGLIGRKARVVVRQQLGHYEAHDQIAAAKHWAQKDYVDATRLAIWGWSYGGFTALKTLEVDAGQTFRYGMAVAPVTDWRLYDSVYTERYMLTPQVNAQGYDASAVRNASALGQSVRFLLMHGTGDDNVHFQNSLRLLDDLDQQGVENYDVHVFPDSDHGIYFHGANRIVYDKLANWLVNAFNGEWLKTANPEPVDLGVAAVPKA
jgi:dipeptidyl aminopeptidase